MGYRGKGDDGRGVRHHSPVLPFFSTWPPFIHYTIKYSRNTIET